MRRQAWTAALLVLITTMTTGLEGVRPAPAEAQVPISLDARQPLAALGAATFQILNASTSAVVFPNLNVGIVHDLSIAAGIVYRLVPNVGLTTVVFHVAPPPPGCVPGPLNPCCGIVTLTSADTSPPAAPTNLQVQ